MSYFPLVALQGIVEPLAGETTKVDINVVVSVAIALSLVLNVFQYLKGRSRRNELKRQRSRLDAFEAVEAIEGVEA